MAGRQAALRLAAALALGAGGLALGACGRRAFHVSGTITIASNIQPRVPKENVVMFIVAKNLGGVPLAVKRIVNPQFPVDYTLDADDLVVPGSHPRDALRLEVEMNTRGNVGSPMRGDFVGAHPDPVMPGERHVYIVVDRQL